MIHEKIQMTAIKYIDFSTISDKEFVGGTGERMEIYPCELLLLTFEILEKTLNQVIKSLQEP